MKIENASQLPKRYFGLHMVEGVAEYKEEHQNNGQPYRIFIGEPTIKNMDPTFEGRPVYVRHVDEVNLDKLENEMAGVVVRSFFNQCDGKHWVEFMVSSDAGHQAIKSGWKLSNAYIPKKFAGGGKWHGVDYAKEVVEGEYEHLALVPNPRYEESIILTAEEFKAYNNEKELELKKLSNSLTKGAKSMFNFFKKTKVENGADFESMSVILPKSQKEKTISQIINDMDEMEMNDMANPDHHVMVGEKKMKINDLLKHYHEMKAKHEAEPKDAHEKKESPAEEKMEHEGKPGADESEKEHAKAGEGHLEHDADGEIHVDIDSHKSKGEGKMEDADDADALEKSLELAEHEIEEMEEMKKNKKKNSAHFEALKNAEKVASVANSAIELSEDKVARGKARYGSGL